MPEKISPLSAKSYWSGNEVIDYVKSSTIRRIQEKMTEIILDALNLEEGASALDIGCGAGFSTGVLADHGLKTIGIDISQDMLNHAIKSVPGGTFVLADFCALPFKDGAFDAVISISSLQWIIGKNKNEIKQKYLAALSEMRRVLNAGGKAGIQFYPATRLEEKIFMGCIKNAGFSGYVIEHDNKRFYVLTLSLGGPLSQDGG